MSMLTRGITIVFACALSLSAFAADWAKEQRGSSSWVIYYDGKKVANIEKESGWYVLYCSKQRRDGASKHGSLEEAIGVCQSECRRY